MIIDLDEGGLFLPGSHSIAMKIEHEHGPFNGAAEVTGSVVDTTGASVPGARITLNALENGAVRHGVSDATGTWTFTGLPPGRYRVTVASTGFVTATRTLTIAARDQAILRATLTVGTVTETVEVTGAAPTALATDAVPSHAQQPSRLLRISQLGLGDPPDRNP